MTYSTVLIANRGEIAVRVMATAKRMGYGTVAIYTEPDRQAPHVLFADQAVYLPDRDGAGEPYLDIGRIIAAAQSAGAEAIHPGYGFLSENADFARACAEAGIIFIGPSPEAIIAMGDKAEGKRLMQAAKVPCVPGYDGADQSTENLAAKAKEIGTPILIKAVAGGGGRGMRFVSNLADFDEALVSARSEALNAFGSDRVILERALDQVRHIEVQIAADAYGNVVHLGERDCSSQRRNQKVIEEAPSPAVDSEIRSRLGVAAVDAAAAINYLGVGTVEFLMDAAGEFFFIEMNTRLQVEHPVTEEITGIDLVEWQLRVAAGEPLPMAQGEIHFYGAAIEARLYAEDPNQDFLPQTGRIESWQPPEGLGLRLDHMIIAGNDISARYDPMIGKIIAYGEDRELARRRLLSGLQVLRIAGLITNKGFLIRLLETPEFQAGGVDTGFITRLLSNEVEPASSEQELIAAGLSYWLQAAEWGLPDDWSSLGRVARRLRLDLDGAPREFTVSAQGQNVQIQDIESKINLTFNLILEDARVAYAETEGNQIKIDHWQNGPDLLVDFGALFLTLTAQNNLDISAGEAGAGAVAAPMAGRILALEVNAGDTVAEGQTLLILEAMKMEHRIRAAISGEVGHIAASVGDQVNRGDILIEVQALHS